MNTTRRAKGKGLEYLSPPLLVCASFPAPGPGTPPHLSLILKSFQSLFPALSPNTLNLSSARRVVLLAYNSATDSVDFRHYLVTIKAHGISRRIRKVIDGKSIPSRTANGNVLNLGKETDIADFILRQHGEAGPDDDGYESAASSASSIGADDGDIAMDLPGDFVGRNNRKGDKRAIKLDEIGPRLQLSLLKMSEGLPGKEGSIIYNRFVKKSKKEVARLKTDHAAKLALKRQRREDQEQNVARKVGATGSAAEESEEGDPDDEWDDENSVTDGDSNSTAESGGEESEKDDNSVTFKKARLS